MTKKMRLRDAVKIPLTLPLGPCWEIEEGQVDSAAFLRTVPTTFSEATTVFVEGSSMAPDVSDLFQQHVDAGSYLPEAQTIWSTGTIQQFRCRYAASLFEALATASLNHAEPELFDHLFLYAGEEPLLEWPDAFHNNMWISLSVPEDRVATLAAALGLRYARASHG
jgi:hypothetical protein